ncbi:carboxynorspermidine decarboxylase [Persicirhabdus sediminis]|uniref:Carboxynorspermidine/carboxyspermidine decarboxylase n=1 Tax=Persicirhabdus sediminis TaxID=454144 RepID=A0A8J7SIV8_9BACT|nr:carboxynorspermidine decarboxylase [Persicirhabdus sediminis]MBK1790904.1 carboxynorspermidine decarboxylase [Persicirhabdus sediminis]
MTDQDILSICNRAELPSPSFIVHRGLLQNNLDLLGDVQNRSGGKIILALKGFAMFSTFPQIRQTLCGTTASSMAEAQLGFDEFGGEVHTYFVAYRKEEIRQLSQQAHHISINSLSQWLQFKEIALSAENKASYGLRINPEYSEVETAIYNPCRIGTRFGITASQLDGVDLSGIDGLHFHSMCEQNSDTLQRTLEQVEAKFGKYLHQMKWLNMGGGHHITRPDYDVDLLVQLIKHMRETYQLKVYLEPGEAVALNTGFLVASVLDIFQSGDRQLAILDTSASAHMPDVLEMPYRPEIIGGGEANEKKYTYELGGHTCLAGDIIGQWSFDQPLEIGSRLVFTDMAHYSMVKTTTFNGVQLPSIASYFPAEDKIEVSRSYGYEDYKSRLS